MFFDILYLCTDRANICGLPFTFNAYPNQNAATARERHNVEEGIQKEEQLLAEQGQLRVDVVDLTRLAQIKADEREQKARDYLKAELRYQKALEDLKTKELTIEDSEKKHKEVKYRYESDRTLKYRRNYSINSIHLIFLKRIERVDTD